jgi:hypothetical protein
MFRGKRLMDLPAVPVAIAGPADADHSKPSGYMIEHLADGLADCIEHAAAAGAGLMLGIEPDALAVQMRWQTWSIGPRWAAMMSGLPRNGDARRPGYDLLKNLQVLGKHPVRTAYRSVSAQAA